MKIIEKTYNWAGELFARTKTAYIVLHHRAGNGDVQSIHNQHIADGSVGIGYHFYVRKDGSVYRGRPVDVQGAHCIGSNYNSVGVCFEGNFESERTMSDAQINAGRELVAYLKRLYPQAEVKQHKELFGTLCPGKNFPFEKIRKGEIKLTTGKATEILKTKAGLESKTIEFLLCYKYGEELVKKLAEAMESNA